VETAGITMTNTRDPLTEAGKRIQQLERDLHEQIAVRNILVLLGKVTSDEFSDIESLVRNLTPANRGTKP
jgi:hypothetical protein